MADNNLSISITADSSKARADLALTESSIRSLRKEQKAAADQFRQTGDRSALDAVTKSLIAQEKAAAGLRKETLRLGEAAKKTGHEIGQAAHASHAHGFYLVENSLQSLNGAFMAIGHNIAGARAGIAGFAIGIVFQKLIDTIVEVNKALTELKKTAGEIGVRPVALKAVQVAAQEAGHDVDAATKVMQGFGKAIEENRNKFAAPVVGGAGLPTVLSGATLETPTPGRVAFPGGQGAGGRMVQVGRGGVPGLTDPTKALDDLDLSKFPKTAEGIEKAARALQARVLELQKTMNSLDFNIFAKANFGVSGKELGEIAGDMEQMEKIIKRIQGPLSAAAAQLERLAAAQGKLRSVREEAMAPGVYAFNQADIAITTALTQFFQAPWGQKINELAGQVSAAWQGMGAIVDQKTMDFQTNWSRMIENMKTNWQSVWDWIVGVAESAIQSLVSKIAGLVSAASAVGTAVSNAVSSAGEAQTASPFATGGYVHGPGTGTSDSILARLSAGEFVINSASVRRLGTSFLSGLNGYADGGLVGRPSLRFAAGGLVPAGGDALAHFHFESGNSFKLSGPREVVGAMVSEAKAQQMRSAGTKPSWYGGRAGS